MKLNYKYAIGAHIMFYEIEMLPNHISGILNMLSTVDNMKNVYLDFAFNVSQFFENVDTTKTNKENLIQRFNSEVERLPKQVNIKTKIINNDDEWYTQTSYRREFNSNYCNKVDLLMWGETDSCFPKETFSALEALTSNLHNNNIYRFTACFADRKMWDSSWDSTVHPLYIDHTYNDKDVDNIHQAKSFMSIDDMNTINSNVTDLEIVALSEPKIDGSCFVISSDVIKCGVNIPGCFIHNDDESFAFMAKKLMGA